MYIDQTHHGERQYGDNGRQGSTSFYHLYQDYTELRKVNELLACPFSCLYSRKVMSTDINYQLYMRYPLLMSVFISPELF